MIPPNYRDSKDCMNCLHVKCTYVCGCCPPDYECSKYGRMVQEGSICDEHMSEEEE